MLLRGKHKLMDKRGTPVVFDQKDTSYRLELLNQFRFLALRIFIASHGTAYASLHWNIPIRLPRHQDSRSISLLWQHVQGFRQTTVAFCGHTANSYAPRISGIMDAQASDFPLASLYVSRYFGNINLFSRSKSLITVEHFQLSSNFSRSICMTNACNRSVSGCSQSSCECMGLRGTRRNSSLPRYGLLI